MRLQYSSLDDESAMVRSEDDRWEDFHVYFLFAENHASSLALKYFGSWSLRDGRMNA